MTTAAAQSDTAVLVDSASLENMELIEDVRVMDAPAAMDIEAAMIAADADYIQDNALNKFRYNAKIKTEEKPDKKAVYSIGTGELLKHISLNVTVPYSYSGVSNYVILQFTVGADSMLYNPEILYSPGTEYSINATAVIEKLQFQFTPATKNGKPVATVIRIPIRFENNNEYRYRH